MPFRVKHFISVRFQHNFEATQPKPYRYWNKRSNQKNFLLDIIKKEGLPGPENLTTKIVRKYKGNSLFLQYKDFQTALNTLFPQINLNEVRKPRNYWKNEDNQKEFLLLFQQKHNLKTIEDWNSTSNIFIKEIGGQSIIKHHGSLLNALKLIYPPNDTFWAKKGEKIKFPRNYFKSIENRRKRLDQIAEMESVLSPIEWIEKDISIQTIKKYQGGISLCRYYLDIYEMLQSIYPEISWENDSNLYDKIKKFPSYWNKIENQKKFIENLADQLQIQKSDFCKIPKKEIINNGGKWLLDHYKSVDNIMVQLFDQKPQYPEKYKEAIKNLKGLLSTYKNNDVPIEIQKQIFKLVNTILEIENNNWGKIKLQQLYSLGLRNILSNYHTKYDAYNCILENWEGKDPKNNEIIKKPTNYFSNDKNIRNWFHEILKYFKFSELQEIQNLSNKTIKEHGGNSILKKYGSVTNALQANFPLQKFYPPKSSVKPRNYWKSKKNQKDFFDSMVKQFNIEDYKDWYGISSRDFIKEGGSPILNYYDSFFHALQALYPEFDWKDSDRKKKPTDFWKNKENILDFLKKVETELQIENLNDWYRISRSQIHEFGGSGLLLAYNSSLLNVLKVAYPEHNWNSKAMKKSKRSKQRTLYILLRKLLPNIEVIEDFVHLEITRKSNFSLQFDIFLPKFNIAFEYQGEHHFQDIPALGSLDLYKERDHEKAVLCKQYDITLVCVPFWIEMQTCNLYSYLMNQNLENLSKILVNPTINKE